MELNNRVIVGSGSTFECLNSLDAEKYTMYSWANYGGAHSPPQSLCIMEVNEIFSKYFANHYKITQLS